MGRHGAAVGLEHDLGIAVVSGDHGNAAHLQGSVHHPAHAGVHGLHSLDGSGKHTGVAHHVAVGKIQDHHVIFAALNALHTLVAHLVGAHLRLQVIGGHLRRCHQHTILPGILLLHAAVEEEGHMGILLRLGNAQLGHAQRAEIFAQAVFHSDPGPRHQHIGHGCVILRIADIGGGEILPLEPVKLRVHNGPGNLPGPVGPVVEENDAVVVGNSALAVTDHRLHKLVRYAVFIALGHGIHGVGILHALTVDHGVVGHLQPLPAFVAVHGVVAAHDGGDLAHADLAALFHALGYKVLAAGGGHITAVQKGVDIDPLQALVLGHLQ